MENDQKPQKKINKVIRFPENKMKRQWLLKIQNADKRLWVNFMFSVASVIVGLSVFWFLLHKMNM